MRLFPSLVPSALPSTAVLTLGLVACLLTPLAPPADGAQQAPAPGPDRVTTPAAPIAPAGTVVGTDGLPQTSDGVVGRIARPLPRTSGRADADPSIRSMWTVAPGVHGVVWDEKGPRGPIRAYLLTVDYRQPGVRVDLATNGAVRNTAPVRKMLARDRAVAGVNGDFYDIGDTGAPLGVGRDRDRGTLNGRASGWNAGFSISASGRPEIGELPVRTTIKERPGLTITNLNSPSVAVGGIGAYTRDWGRTAGSRITDGQTRDVRMVMVRGGRVVANRTSLPRDTRIDGTMLVGRGPGARALASLRVGQRATVRWVLKGSPQMAVTGNKTLVDDGLVTVVDDREMHPRTAIGIDRDTHQLLLLAVDGRQRFSRGFTMVELAEKMIDLGAEEALNLDGGGSTTMVARRNGTTGVINRPSDGFERSVANGIAITYRKPA